MIIIDVGQNKDYKDCVYDILFYYMLFRNSILNRN